MEIIMSVLPFIFLLLSALMLSYPLKLKKQKKQLKRIAKLPPGSMGWPFIGETIQLYSQDPNIFFATKQKRYGEIFKTHILGCPCVMLASPEAARFVLVTHAHLFKPTYPKSKEKMIGPNALFFHQGEYHTRIRKLVQSSLYPEAIRKKVADIEAAAVSALESWASDRKVINTFREMKKFSFEVGVLSIFGHLDEYYKQKLKENYSIVEKGYNSFPTKMPRTAYQNALSGKIWTKRQSTAQVVEKYASSTSLMIDVRTCRKTGPNHYSIITANAEIARKRLGEILGEVIRERKEKRILDKDMLSQFMSFEVEDDEGRGRLREDEVVADNVIGVLFAAQDTTASMLTWILKYLHDDPKLLEAVKAEQMAIFKMNGGGKRPLTWAQTRKMPFTYKVILESLRMASIISFTFREAVVDVEYKGYLIPKGWKVMPLFRNIHHNPEFFPDPHIFDPSRFEVAPKPNTFMPFGSGVHSCPGNELAKLEILILIHHLITNFRWEIIGTQSGIQYGPFPVPQHGLPIRIWKDSSNEVQAECP